MKTAPHPAPGAFELRAVVPGDLYSRPVEGGVRRCAVEGHGIVVETADQDIFIPSEKLVAALVGAGWAVREPKGATKP